MVETHVHNGPQATQSHKQISERNEPGYLVKSKSFTFLPLLLQIQYISISGS